MSSLSVKNRAQSLFPDGLQDSMILRNDGPYTVFVDNDATVDATSHAIPPTGTMAWDSTRPLFVSLDPALEDDVSSTLTLVRNSQPAQFGNDVDNLLYRATFVNTLNFGSGSGLIECSAYASLIVRVSNSELQLRPPATMTNNFYRLTVTWYDSTRTLIGASEIIMPPAWGSVGSSTLSARCTVPVMGTYCSIEIDNTAGLTSEVNDFRVVGTTRTLPLMVACGASDTYCYTPSGSQGININWLTSGRANSMRFSGFAVGNITIYVPNIAPHVKLAYGAPAGAGAPGNGGWQFVSAIDGDVRFTVSNTITTATGSFSGEGEATLPMDQPIQLNFNPGTRGGVSISPFYLNLTWYD